MSGGDRDAFLVAAFEQLREIGHHESALRLRRLMAALTVCLKNRAHIAVVADRLVRSDNRGRAKDRHED